MVEEAEANGRVRLARAVVVVCCGAVETEAESEASALGGRERRARRHHVKLVELASVAEWSLGCQPAACRVHLERLVAAVVVAFLLLSVDAHDAIVNVEEASGRGALASPHAQTKQRLRDQVRARQTQLHVSVVAVRGRRLRIVILVLVDEHERIVVDA